MFLAPASPGTSEPSLPIKSDHNISIHHPGPKVPSEVGPAFTRFLLRNSTLHLTGSIGCSVVGFPSAVKVELQLDNRDNHSPDKNCPHNKKIRFNLTTVFPYALIFLAEQVVPKIR